MSLTLNEKLKEDRRLSYKAMLDIGAENPHPGWQAFYLAFSILYDVLVWIVKENDKKK